MAAGFTADDPPRFVPPVTEVADRAAVSDVEGGKDALRAPLVPTPAFSRSAGREDRALDNGWFCGRFDELGAGEPGRLGWGVGCMSKSC
ncbi:hypothetical protein C0Z18_09185 [Trinickia dabaoshanensis]|uniref:Uncharacterized protein n=1 Tax=Trinickia dabaoshanensis TaxID=564714 RepID=A0A2N7VU84_9BURK|nr:hypothetical protein C0Z18_09185 [Trinickia dabaoshanensis]